MKENIYICTTLRHLFFSFIISRKRSSERNHIIFCFDHQDIDTSSIILKDNLDKNTSVYFVNERDMINNFARGNLFSFSSFISRNVHFGLKGIVFPRGYIGKELSQFNRGCSVYMYHNGTFLSKYFRYFHEVFLIEDGLVNYSAIEISNPIKRFLRFISNKKHKYVMGEEHYVKKIYLMEPHKSNPKIRFKVEDLKALLGDIDFNETQRLLSIFNVSQIHDGSVLFLTQALDVAGLCSKDTKVDIYKKILNQLTSRVNCKVYVKIHPAEDIQDYSTLKSEIENIEFIDGKIPFELLHLTCKSAHVYSLYSSSLLFVDLIKGGGNLIVSEDVWKRFECSEIVSESIMEFNRLHEVNK